MKATSMLVMLWEVPDERPIPEIASMTLCANCGGDRTLKLCDTFGAALKLSLPLCAAVIVQMPVPPKVTALPETEQGPDAVKATGRPDDAVALTATGGSPTILSATAAKLMDWSCLAETVKVPKKDGGTPLI